MNILYVTVIIAFAINLVATFDSLMVNNARTKQRVEKNVQDFYLNREIGQITAAAVELYTLNGGICPANTRMVNLNNGVNGCFPSAPGVNQNCFRVSHSHITNTSNNGLVCIPQDQNLSFNLLSTNPYTNWASLILRTSVLNAYSAGGGGGGAGDYGGGPDYGGGGDPCGVGWPPTPCPGGGIGGGTPPPTENPINYSDTNVINASTTEHGTYTGMAARYPIPGSAASNNASVSVSVRLPAQNTPPAGPAPGNVNTNFINCNVSHTKCFTVTFCLNGQATCNGIAKMQQTFAFRLF